MPVEVIFRKAYELQPYQITYTATEAASRANSAAVESAQAALPLDDEEEQLSTITIKTETISLGDGIQRVHAVAEALADIGVYQKFTEDEKAAAEQQLAENGGAGETMDEE